MKWSEYADLIKDGPIDVRVRPPRPEDCDNNGKFLAFFPKERPPTWGYLSLAYIEANEPEWMRTRKEGEAGHVPMFMLISHWLPCPPLIGEDDDC